MSWVDDEADAASLEKALAYIERVNADASEPWSAFIYRSLHLPTADDAAALGRFFVHVPGEDFDRYLQFGLRSDPLSELPNAVSLVSVQKTDPESGKPLPAPLARATDLWRIREGGATTLSTRFDVKGIVQNCYECHKTPLLPITPDAFVFDERRFGKTLKSVNERMASYRGLRFFGLDPADYGPGIGPVDSPRRTREFMEACSAGSISDPGQLVRIENAMNCQGCHDGTYRGELNFPSALHPQPTSGRSLVWMYVVEHGTMPLGRVDLTREDRAVLAECLRLELYGDFGSMPGLLEEWLAAKACWGALP